MCAFRGQAVIRGPWSADQRMRVGPIEASFTQLTGGVGKAPNDIDINCRFGNLQVPQYYLGRVLLPTYLSTYLGIQGT
jgi:hypothetical protein